MTMPFPDLALTRVFFGKSAFVRTEMCQCRVWRGRFSSSAGLRRMLAGKVAVAFATSANVSVFCESCLKRAGPAVESDILLTRFFVLWITFTSRRRAAVPGGFCMPTPTPRVSMRTRRVALACLAVFTFSVVITTSIVSYLQRQPRVQRINYSQLYSLAETGGATALVIEGENVTVTRPDGSIVEATVTGETTQHDIVQLFRDKHVPVEFQPVQPGLLANVMNWGLPILMLGLIGVAGWRVYASLSGRGSFELTDQNGQQNVGWDDVAGVDEAKAELTETIEFLRNPDRFSRLGGRVPRGILLYGAPGTGKTLLARAAAKEAGVAFLAASGSSFQEKFAGLGAARVRHLFPQGRKPD